MRQIGARADVHVQAGDRQLVLLRPLDAVFQLLVPNAVLRLRAARVDLLAMSVAEARIDPQRDPRQRTICAEPIPAQARASPY